MITSLSLANKYRPQTFDEMIGQHHIIGILKAKMQSSRDSLQNYLLTGSRGTGKTTSARILAKAINCLQPHDGNPCNVCANCQTIMKETSLDYIEWDAASHTQVDKIREEILDRASYPPVSLKKKIYVIDEVHMLSTGSFNALLKMIEEPKDHFCFILATTALEKVPDTIVSRCQVFQFKKVSEQEMVKNLANICEKEGFTYDTEALELIALISDGGVRDSVKYLDQVSVLGKITQENVSRFLGVSPTVLVQQFITTVKMGNQQQIFEMIQEISNQGIDLFQFAKQIIGFINTHLLEDTAFYLSLSEAFMNILKQIKFYPYPEVVYKLALYNMGKEEFGNTTIERRDEELPHSTSETLSEPRKDISLTSPSEVKELPIKNEEVQIPEKATLSAEGNSLPDGGTELSPDLRPTILSQLSKPTVQSNLKDHVLIEKIENNVVHLVATNKIAEMLLQNMDTKKELEEAFSKQLHTSTTISFIFEAKEAYFARTLGM